MLVDNSYIKWVCDSVKVNKLDLNNLAPAQKEWIENSESIVKYFEKQKLSYSKGYEDATNYARETNERFKNYES